MTERAIQGNEIGPPFGGRGGDLVWLVYLVCLVDLVCLVQRTRTARQTRALAHIIHDGSSRNGGVARDKRGPKAEGRRSGREVPNTSVFSLETVSPVALFPPVSPVSLESGIGDCSRNAQ